MLLTACQPTQEPGVTGQHQRVWSSLYPRQIRPCWTRTWQHVGVGCQNCLGSQPTRTNHRESQTVTRCAIHAVSHLCTIPSGSQPTRTNRTRRACSRKRGKVTDRSRKHRRDLAGTSPQRYSWRCGACGARWGDKTSGRSCHITYAEK